jgi:hypothetical protein
MNFPPFRLSGDPVPRGSAAPASGFGLAGTMHTRNGARPVAPRAAAGLWDLVFHSDLPKGATGHLAGPSTVRPPADLIVQEIDPRRNGLGPY